MTRRQENSLCETIYEQFEYRLVYLRPNAHADERITVGLIASSDDGLEARFVSSVASLNLMTNVFGEAGVEQYHFAVAELRRVVSRSKELDLLAMPTDLLCVGDKVAAYSRDRRGLMMSVLASSSCLIRGSTSRASEVSVSSGASRISTALFHEVSLLNPLKAKDLFHRKVTVDIGDEFQEFDLPIYGTKIFGAPISLSVSAQKMRAEAYVAKFHWLRKFLQREPKVYVLLPYDRSNDGAHKDSSLRELCAVAEASNVTVRISDSTSELATFVIQDEAA